MTGVPGDGMTAIAGKYLTFALSREQYGVDILKVQEIIGITPVTRVPRSPEFVKGVINLRGKIIPVIDLRLRFGMDSIPYDEKTCIIVVNLPHGQGRIALGVIVDTVVEVLNFGPTDIEPPPDYGVSVDSTLLLGIGKREERLSMLLDIEQVLTRNETEEILRLEIPN